MTDGQKTILAAAFLAAVVGVYTEVSYHQRQRVRARHHTTLHATDPATAAPPGGATAP